MLIAGLDILLDCFLYKFKLFYMFFDHQRKVQQKNRRHIVFGAVIASFVTGTLALLFAPKPGKELRQDIVKGAGEAKIKAKELKNKALSFMQKEADEMKQKAEEAREMLIQKINHQKDITLEKIEEEDKK